MINFFKKFKPSLSYRRSGFALLYAILLTGAVLSVGVILMNIITKQLIFSSVSRQSETSYYYLANSGRECLVYYLEWTNDIYYTEYVSATENNTIFQPSPSINCFGQKISLKSNGNSTKPIYTASLEFADNTSLDLSIQLNKDCLDDDSSTTCGGDSLIGRSSAVILAKGYGSGNRSTMRTAVYARRGI